MWIDDDCRALIDRFFHKCVPTKAGDRYSQYRYDPLEDQIDSTVE